MPFDPVDPKQPLPDMEQGILQYWKEEDVFKRSIKQRCVATSSDINYLSSNDQKQETFSFYDGPPFATGLPHYGHLLAGTIKDVIPRYQTMKGKFVQRRFGWDCHGLPIENLIEQEHDIKSKREIEERGVKWFNGLCRDSVQRYTTEWRKTVERMGRWVDMDWDYRTMDPDFMESMWWGFATLYNKDLIYEGHKPMHICPRCVTPLSNFEVTQGYVDRTDMSVIMTFPLKDDPSTILLAWTTTPWSLPGNLWLLVGPDIKYSKVKMGDITYILAEKLVEKVFKKHEYEVVGTVKAKELEGKRYVPLFDYYVDTVIPSTASKKPVTYGEKCFYVRVDTENEVSDDDGTGIVHLTNSNGEDGFKIAQKEKLDILHHLEMDSSFKPEVTDFAGLKAKPEGDDPMATDKAVIAKLKEMDRHFDSYTFSHSYPHCWRCDTPLLNYAASSWFVSVEKIKDQMLKNNEKTKWVPAHIRDGRYGKWLQGARDWALSRNRYWGTPLPIWRCEDTGDIEVINGREDLLEHCKIRFTKISVLRHGESEGNTIPIYQGEVPGTDLTKTGKEHAKNAAKQIDKGMGVDVIYCSPLARCQQTAEAIAKETGAEVVVDERLREVSFGEYEGKNIDFSDLTFVKAKRAKKLEENSPESIYHFPGMETWEQVQERVSAFLADILPQHRSEHVVVVTHADPMRHMQHFFTQEDPVKISHQPYPQLGQIATYFWDHHRKAETDLHKDSIDDIVWSGSKSDKSVEVTLARHGQTDWNKQGITNGSGTDNPLNATGKEQAKELAKELKGKKIDVIVSSDLERAAETAKILSKELNIPVEAYWEELREHDTGDWDGKKQKDITEKHPNILEDVKTIQFHHLDPPNGETLSAFLERMDCVCDRLLNEFPGKHVLVVSHGGTSRALYASIENLSYKEAALYRPGNAESHTTMLHPRLRRIPEVLDCWFESGSMPYAQEHFPFSTGDSDLPPSFPADFIAEGVDQTRAWFYTLMVLATALFKDTPFMNVVVNGIVLAEDGKKMSKRLKNYPEPMEIVDKYGADAIRFTLMNSPAVRGEDLRISEKIIEESMRSVLLPLWNTYSFFVTYANAAGFEPIETRRKSTHPLDTWIQAEVQDLVNRMTEQMDNYDLSATCSELFETIDALTNWYVRLSRRRFAGKGSAEGLDASEKAHIEVHNEDQQDALHTLYDVLLTLSQVLCPFCPYITDAIYLNLVPEEHGSIHLTDWPQTRKMSKEEEQLIAKTRIQRTIVSLGHSIRGEHTIKVRQPLTEATVALPPSLSGSVSFSGDDLQLLRQELNVKQLHVTEDPGALAKAIARVDARKVGPRLGARVQEIINAGKNGDFTQHDDGTVQIADVELTPDEVDIVYQSSEEGDEQSRTVAADKGVVVSIDTTVTEELELEGNARDLIRTVQRLRKEEGLAFTDTIQLHMTGADAMLEHFADMIAHETNARLEENKGKEHVVEIGDQKLTVKFMKV